MPIRSDARDDEHALADDLPALPHMFIARVDAQIRVRRLGQGRDSATLANSRPTVPPTPRPDSSRNSCRTGLRDLRTLRVETPSTYISISASTSAFSLRW